MTSKRRSAASAAVPIAQLSERNRAARSRVAELSRKCADAGALLEDIGRRMGANPGDIGADELRAVLGRDELRSLLAEYARAVSALEDVDAEYRRAWVGSPR